MYGMSGSKKEKVLCLVGYALVPVFFVALYFLMTETLEDIIQADWGKNMSIGGILRGTYNVVPRLGEYYQRIAVHYMTPQLSFGLDMVFRLITAIAATGLIYLTTAFVVKRRPKLEYKDVLVYLGIMAFFMISIFGETFTYRFSIANNYIWGMLSAIAFLMIFRIPVQCNKWWKFVLTFLLGFAFGISTEIAPVLILGVIVVYILAKICREKSKTKEVLVRYRSQIIALVGLLVGIGFFYLGSGLSARTSGWYAETYDYVSLMGIFANPISTIRGLVGHVWYNLRYVFFAIPLMLSYIFIEATLLRKDKQSELFWQIILFVFCILFIGATSLIAVHDDLYVRFMVPVFFALVIATMMFVVHVLDFAKIAQKKLSVSAIIMIGLNTVLIADMVFAFTIYNRLLAEKLETAYYDPDRLLLICEDEEEVPMSSSPIFNLEQGSPFGWGDPKNYTKFGL